MTGSKVIDFSIISQNYNILRVSIDLYCTILLGHYYRKQYCKEWLAGIWIVNLIICNLILNLYLVKFHWRFYVANTYTSLYIVEQFCSYRDSLRSTNVGRTMSGQLHRKWLQIINSSYHQLTMIRRNFQAITRKIVPKIIGICDVYPINWSNFKGERLKLVEKSDQVGYHVARLRNIPDTMNESV